MSSSYLSSSARRLLSKSFKIQNSASSRTLGARSLHATTSRAALYANADAKTFQQVTGTRGRIVLVDFYADWCGPCHQLAPVLENLTADPNTSGSGLPLDLVKVDTDSDEGVTLARTFKVTALPTVIAFKDGVQVTKFTGALPPPSVKKFIESL